MYMGPLSIQGSSPEWAKAPPHNSSCEARLPPTAEQGNVTANGKTNGTFADAFAECLGLSWRPQLVRNHRLQKLCSRSGTRLPHLRVPEMRADPVGKGPALERQDLALARHPALVSLGAAGCALLVPQAEAQELQSKSLNMHERLRNSTSRCCIDVSQSHARPAPTMLLAVRGAEPCGAGSHRQTAAKAAVALASCAVRARAERKPDWQQSDPACPPRPTIPSDNAVRELVFPICGASFGLGERRGAFLGLFQAAAVVIPTPPSS